MKERSINEAIITDIQRFSLHDGPGIRTTVFFKGCDMRCYWCHNPETWKYDAEVLYHKSKCTHCGECVLWCSHNAHVIVDGKHVYDKNKCVDCGKCVIRCISGSLEMCGYSITASELVLELIKDKKYYKASDGGVTFSGGEPLLQAKFLKAAVEMLRNEGIHTAVETALHCKREALDMIMDDIDLFIADIKIMDEEKHQKATGVGNHMILDNIKYLSENKKDIIIRTPMIPEFNDDAESLNAISEFIKTLPSVLYHEKMPYNRLIKKRETKNG